MTHNNATEPFHEIRAGTMRAKGPAARLVVLYVAAFLLASIVLIADDPPSSNLFLFELYRLRHVLFFGIGGLIVLELTALIGRRWIRKRSLYYAVAGVAVIILSLALQLFFPDNSPLPRIGFCATFSAASHLSLSAPHWIVRCAGSMTVCGVGRVRSSVGAPF